MSTTIISGGIFQVKAYSPDKQINVNAMRARILNALKEQGQYTESLFEQTVDNWDDPPSFEFTIQYKGGDAAIFTGVTGTDIEVKKWNWLEQGTAVRRAKLKDWQSHTSPGTLNSGPGGGKFLYASPNLAYPGIQPRGWLKIIAKKTSSRFSRKINDAIRAGLPK